MNFKDTFKIYVDGMKSNRCGDYAGAGMVTGKHDKRFGNS